jgi:hypothetical protein
MLLAIALALVFPLASEALESVRVHPPASTPSAVSELRVLAVAGVVLVFGIALYLARPSYHLKVSKKQS